jgi:hypothetical protein
MPEHERRKDLTKEVSALRKDLDALKKDIAELLSIFRASKGFIRVLGWAGVFAKWLLAIGAAIGLIWAFFLHGPKQ